MYDPGMTTGTKVDVALCLMKPKPNAGRKRVFEPIESDTEAEWSEPEEEATNEDHDYVPVSKKSKKICSPPAPSRSGIAPNDKSTNFDPLEGSSTEKKFKFKKLANNDEVLEELTVPVVNSNILPEGSTVLAKRPEFKRPDQTIQNRSPAKKMRTPLRDIGNESQNVTKGTLLFNYDYSLLSMNF
jgi:hypothetical protein